MGRKIRAIKYGYCPEIVQHTSIEVTFAEIHMARGPKTYYKKLSFRCEHRNSDGCETCGPNSLNCPLLMAAQEP
jgi:hypothetical protein